MIFQGVKLTLLGMIVVFSFLVLLLILIHLAAKLLKPYTEKEALTVTPRRPPGTREEKSTDDNKRLTAVISAAIAAHRARQGRYRLP